jgi:hypothetical protein
MYCRRLGDPHCFHLQGEVITQGHLPMLIVRIIDRFVLKMGS